MQLVEHRADGTFTEQELERLAIYRAAVAAGFYTDWDGSAETTDTEELAWLRDTAQQPDGGAYPFTACERQLLEGRRAAVANGFYSDDLPPADTDATPEKPTR